MSKEKITAIRMTPELREQLEQLAKADDRSISSYVRLILESHVKSRRN